MTVRIRKISQFFQNTKMTKEMKKVTHILFYVYQFIGNMPPPSHQSLDLAGSREQRNSAFELYRKPQLGNMPMHHHNVR